MLKNIKENYQIEKDFTKKLRNYREYNKVISEYFYRLGHETSDNLYFRTSSKVADCNKVWFLDYFKDLNIKNFDSTFLCNNKFCFNCKKIKQAMRMSKYSDYIRQQKNLYHLVLTVPNCSDLDLRDVLKRMAATFKRFYGILKGADKFSLPFDFEVVGAIRSLEITYSHKGFHPHYHVLISLDQEIELNKNEMNKFSYSYGTLVRTFSDIEIYLQKLWYCLYNKVRLNKIDSVDLGYSVILDKFKEGDFLELFKYMMKEQACVDVAENKMLLSYSYFKALYFSTYRMKQIQGYGIFWRVQDDKLDIDGLRDNYDKILDSLRAISSVESRIEYLSKEDWDNLRFEDEEDEEEFKKKHSVVDLDKSIYISFKKYVGAVQRLHNEENVDK